MVYKKNDYDDDEDDIKQLERPLKLESSERGRVHNGLVVCKKRWVFKKRVTVFGSFTAQR